ncbi:hypothetical protein INT45_004027, partial [Circinella minor]
MDEDDNAGAMDKDEGIIDINKVDMVVANSGGDGVSRHCKILTFRVIEKEYRILLDERAPTTLSDKLINTHNITQSTIITSTARQHSKRHSSATPLYITKIPPTKKPNTGFGPKTLSENMISRAEKQESRHRVRTTSTVTHRRSLSPQTGPNPSHLACLALKADQQTEEKFSNIINPMEELLQRMVAVENRATTSEQRL